MDLKDFIGQVVLSTVSKRRFRLMKITAPEIKVVSEKPGTSGYPEHYVYPTINGDPISTGKLMFENPALKLKLNPKPVYIHRNNAEGNLSFDLQRMHASNLEMCQLLAKNPLYPKKHEAVLHRSIVFKYLYDTKQLKLLDWLKYADKVLDNGVYKIYTKVLTLLK